jgi:hypothetical protein
VEFSIDRVVLRDHEMLSSSTPGVATVFDTGIAYDVKEPETSTAPASMSSDWQLKGSATLSVGGSVSDAGESLHEPAQEKTI